MLSKRVMFKSLLRRLLGIIALLILAVFWVLLDARPALANDPARSKFSRRKLNKCNCCYLQKMALLND